MFSNGFLFSVLQENFGPNIASFVNEEHVSMHTSKGSAARIASGLAKPAQTAMTQAHGFDSLVFEERPVLARSWLYQPSGALPLPPSPPQLPNLVRSCSTRCNAEPPGLLWSTGYVWNEAVNVFDHTDAVAFDKSLQSTTTRSFPAPPMQRATPGRTLKKKQPYTGGYNKGLWQSRVAFQAGDKHGLPRMAPRAPKSETATWQSETAGQQAVATQKRAATNGTGGGKVLKPLTKVTLDPLGGGTSIGGGGSSLGRKGSDLSTGPPRPDPPRTGFTQVGLQLQPLLRSLLQL